MPEPDAPGDESEAPLASAGYRSTELRAPSHPLHAVAAAPDVDVRDCIVSLLGMGELTDLTRGADGGEAQGQRIRVHGTVRDTAGAPVPGAAIEIWQANAAGRYRHDADDHDAPLDPNFTGYGLVVTDADGRYEFLTIEPGAYPWGNHDNAWRPKHIHFSVFGASVASRVVTQMYFDGDPLLDLDPIFMAVPAHSRQTLVASTDWDRTQPGYALAYRFDMVLR